MAFGWMIAAKVWLVLALAFSAGTSLYVGGVFQVRDDSLWWLLPGALFFGQTFWFGTISFNLGLDLLLILACLLYRKREGTVALLTLILGCFFMHFIVYAAALVMILLYCMQRRQWKPTYLALTTIPLALWYLLGRVLTHSKESNLGYTPVSHLGVAIVSALLLLVIGLRWPHKSMARMLAVLLPGLYVATGFAAVVCRAIPASHQSSKLHSVINLLSLKAIDPFGLFGFVNIVHSQPAAEAISASLTILHKPIFLTLIALDVFAGLILMLGIARGMNQAAVEIDDARFMWDFVALFALLYFLSPPNALGVIGMDMRLAQLALAPALFLMARKSSRALQLSCIPLVVLALASLYQFEISQRQVEIPQTATYLPAQIGHFSSVDPTVLLWEYDELSAGHLDGSIFPTGIFVKTAR